MEPEEEEESKKQESGKILSNLKNILSIIMSNPTVAKVVLIIAIVLFVLAAVMFVVVLNDGTYREGDLTNPSYVVNQHINQVEIGEDGNIHTSMTAQELWDQMIVNNNRALQYLDSPEELLKLMNAQMATQYLDTRTDVSQPIDWTSINGDINSSLVQGAITLKRSGTSGEVYNMTYVDPETFQSYIDKYNNSGSETDKQEALRHFTLERSPSIADGIANPIEAGSTILIPEGLGSVHSYMGWQCITSTTSTQYILREQAGMNFDEEGFGKINGRYVIACTTTYGNVGDYVDFYQVDGTIIPCIIGDIKNQNDNGCNKWGHLNGTCIIEFVVDKNTWYSNGQGSHVNPGTASFHPEWNQNITKAINGGSYFDNSEFGTEEVEASERTVNGETDTEEMFWFSDYTNITSPFGYRTDPINGGNENHKGVDVGAPLNSNVYACEAGTVTIAGWSNSAGNWVVIDHGNGYVSKYMHNSVLRVSAGDTVEKGQLIALSGNTGNSTGPHCHFQIESNGIAIDPLSFKYSNGMGDGNSGIGSSTTSNSSKSTYHAKVATWSESSNKIESNDPDIDSSETSTKMMTSTNINYEKLVSGYKLPFDYLWSLLLISQDKDFVLELADLAMNSDIQITVFDNYTVNTNVVTDTYTKKKRTDTTAKVSIYYGDESTDEHAFARTKDWTDEESTDYKVTQTTTVGTNIVNTALTKASTWVADYEQTYTFEIPDSTSTSNTEELDNIDYPDEPNETTRNQDTYGHAADLLKEEIDKKKEDYKKVVGNINFIQEKIYNAIVNRNKETTNTEQKAKYVESPPTTILKDDVNSSDANFVTVLSKSVKAKSNITSASSWLFKLLEENESTSDMVDITKYLLYKSTNKSYGVIDSEEITKAYDPANFKSISDNGDNIQYSESSIEVANGTAAQKLAYLFPNGIPTAQADCAQYITSAEVAMTKKDGTKYIGTIQVHKAVVKDVQDVFKTAQDGGFKIYDAGGYSYRTMNNGGSGNLSHHSYGIAIDINVAENYSHQGSTIFAGNFWNPTMSEYSIPKDGLLVKAFEAKGWKWGGYWSGNYQDYMHFSFTGN